MNAYNLAVFLRLGAAIHDAASKSKGATVMLDKEAVEAIDKVILEVCPLVNRVTMIKALEIVEKEGINDN